MADLITTMESIEENCKTIPAEDKNEVEEVDGISSNIPKGKTRDSKPVMSELRTNVINQYAAHWKKLALKLGLADHRIETISENNKFNPNRTTDCCIAVFEEWIGRGDYSPTWGKLSDAIDEIENDEGISVCLMMKMSVANETQKCKERYKGSNFFSTDYNYALCQTKEYVELVFMLYKDKTLTDVHNIAKIQHGGNIQEPTCKSHFSNASQEKTLDNIFVINDKFIFIFEGAPGIGKTVVAKQIAVEWANNKILRNIKLLLLLYFRDPGLQKVEDFSQLMKYCNFSNCENYFNERQGKNLLLIFDGFDEVSKDAKIYLFFENLLSRNVLPCCSIVFTSRPYITVGLHHFCDCKIEILGISEDDRYNFLIKNNVSDEDGNKVKEFLQNNIIMNSLCYIPFNLAILLRLVAEKKELPKTQTELIKKSIDITIRYHIKKDSNQSDVKNHDLIKCTKNIVDSLSVFAYMMAEKEKLVFTETEINTGCKAIGQNINAFGLIQVVQFTNSEALTETLYSFVHFSVQEYLVAHYLSRYFTVIQSYILHHSFWDVKYFGIWKMYIGITQGEKFALQHFLSGENYFVAGIRYLKGLKFPGVSNKNTVSKISRLYLYQMFLEAPDSEVKETLNEVVKDGIINLSHEALKLEAIGLLTYSITRSYITMNWKIINLSHCKISDTECKKIFQDLSLDDGRQKPVVQYLNLSNNSITFDATNAFNDFFCDNSNIHSGSTRICCLDISGNSINNYKVLNNLVRKHSINNVIISNNEKEVNCQALENNDTIESLNLSYNNHWPTTQWMLPILPSLHTLDVGYSYFKDDFMRALQVHDDIFPSLQKLVLSHCHLSGDGIAKLLCVMLKTVEPLELSYEHIEIKSLHKFLCHNNSLQQLYLAATDLNGTQILNCVQALKCCLKLELLDISENDMIDDEAELVIGQCKEITSLKELKIKDIYITKQVLGHPDIFSIRNYRDPIKRKILVVGMKKTGKSTLIKNLINESSHSFVTPKSTNEIQEITRILFINGKFYKCTFIDTPGLTYYSFNNTRKQLYLIDEINLIMFVFKHGQNHSKAVSAFADLYEDARHLSVAIITCCDTLAETEYENITREFGSDPCTKKFSSDVSRVYPIGFPNTDGMKETAAEISRGQIENNISKLHQHIIDEMSSRCIHARNVEKDHKCPIM